MNKNYLTTPKYRPDEEGPEEDDEELYLRANQEANAELPKTHLAHMSLEARQKHSSRNTVAQSYNKCFNTQRSLITPNPETVRAVSAAFSQRSQAGDKQEVNVILW